MGNLPYLHSIRSRALKYLDGWCSLFGVDDKIRKEATEVLKKYIRVSGREHHYETPNSAIMAACSLYVVSGERAGKMNIKTLARAGGISTTIILRHLPKFRKLRDRRKMKASSAVQ